MFQKYEYVYAVYKAGNFTKAAEDLFISQPSLSVAVQKIENKIGAPIFERTGGGVKLTEIGREYIACAEKMMSLHNDFLNRINDIYKIETGKITVGGTNYLSSFVLPRIINSFSVLHPKIEVNLVEANSKSIREMLDSEIIDIAIDSFDENMDVYDGFSLVKERILLCVPCEYEINNQLEEFRIHPQNIYRNTIDINSIPTVHIEVFKDVPFVLLKNGNDMYDRAMRIFNNGGIVPKISFSVDQLNISYALTESGMGCCFATDTLFRYGRFTDNVWLYNVSEEHGSRNLYIAHKKNKYCTRTMSEFMRIAREVVH